MRLGGWSVPSTGGGGAYSLESRQAAGDHSDDGVSGPLGPTAFLARDGTGVSDQLGGGLSFGGMVCGLGFGASEAPRSPVHRGGRDPLGPGQKSGPISDGDLSNR